MIYLFHSIIYIKNASVFYLIFLPQLTFLLYTRKGDTAGLIIVQLFYQSTFNFQPQRYTKNQPLSHNIHCHICLPSIPAAYLYQHHKHISSHLFFGAKQEYTIYNPKSDCLHLPGLFCKSQDFSISG